MVNSFRWVISKFYQKFTLEHCIVLCGDAGACILLLGGGGGFGAGVQEAEW